MPHTCMCIFAAMPPGAAGSPLDRLDGRMPAARVDYLRAVWDALRRRFGGDSSGGGSGSGCLAVMFNIEMLRACRVLDRRARRACVRVYFIHLLGGDAV